MVRFNTQAQDVPAPPARSPAEQQSRIVTGLLTIATATSVLLSGLNALLQIIKIAVELARHGS